MDSLAQEQKAATQATEAVVKRTMEQLQGMLHEAEQHRQAVEHQVTGLQAEQSTLQHKVEETQRFATHAAVSQDLQAKTSRFEE